MFPIREPQPTAAEPSSGNTPPRLVLPEWTDGSTSRFVVRMLSDAAFDTKVDIGLPVAHWRQDFPRVLTALAALPYESEVPFATEFLHYIHTTSALPRREETDPFQPYVLGAYNTPTARYVAEKSQPAVLERLANLAAVDLSQQTVAAQQAMQTVVDHPSLLAMEGVNIVVIGGDAACSPAAVLAACGARVHVVSRHAAPRIAGEYARLVADVLLDTDSIVEYIAALPGPVLIVSTVYAPGSQHVHLAVALDAIIAHVVGRRSDVTVCIPGSPTESYTTVEGKPTGAVLVAQGPNYAVAKFIERARLLLLADAHYQATCETPSGNASGYPANLDGVAGRLDPITGGAPAKRGARVIRMVLPPTLSSSVLRDRRIEKALAAAPRVGIHPTTVPDTQCAAAALLAVGWWQATQHPRPAFPPRLSVAPEFAIHGGLWFSRLPVTWRLVIGMVKAALPTPRKVKGRSTKRKVF
ncbi:hypothetical protein ACFPVT_02175 [Corynebacterium choanae]|nr:hypothetical protein [Corynebacterium choanae]